eukprot:760573_1
MTAHNLVELAEVLSGKTCAAKDRVKKRPETETARLQSTRLALDFISQVGVTPEKIPSADDLVLYDRDAVLGLLWSLMSEFERFGDAQMDTPMLVSMKRWVLQKLSYYPELTIRNFTNGWKDGKVLCVLIHSIAGKRMDFRVLNDTDPFANISRAFRDAKKMLMVDLKLKAKEFQDLDERGMVLLLSEPDSASSLESALSSRSTGDIGAWSPFAAVSRSARHQVSAPQFASAHAVLSGAHDGIHLTTADTVPSVELHGGKTFATRIAKESVSTPQGNSVRLTFAEERDNKIKRCQHQTLPAERVIGARALECAFDCFRSINTIWMIKKKKKKKKKKKINLLKKKKKKKKKKK